MPSKALAGTVRYLRFAKQQVGRTDLALASYHMGIGNLQRALSLYGASDIPYTQLYFDSTPLNHAAAWRLLYGLGDDSSTYLWRVLAAKRLMKLYRTDRPALDAVIAGSSPLPTGAPRALAPGHGLRFPKGAELLPRAATVAETIGTDVQKISARRRSRSAPRPAARSTSRGSTARTVRPLRSSSCSTASARLH